MKNMHVTSYQREYSKNNKIKCFSFLFFCYILINLFSCIAVGPSKREECKDTYKIITELSTVVYLLGANKLNTNLSPTERQETLEIIDETLLRFLSGSMQLKTCDKKSGRTDVYLFGP